MDTGKFSDLTSLLGGLTFALGHRRREGTPFVQRWAHQHNTQRRESEDNGRCTKWGIRFHCICVEVRLCVVCSSVMISRCSGGNVSTELASKEFSDNLCTFLIHFVDTGAAVDLSDLVQFVVMLDNRHGGFLVNAFEEYQLFRLTWSGKSRSRNRFLMLSSLSSSLPLVSPRFRSRFSMTSSVVA